MKQSIFWIISIATVPCLNAQVNDLREIVDVAFHDERVHDKVFVNFETRIPRNRGFSSGTYCLIRWTSKLDTIWPELRGKLTLGGRWFFTDLVSKPADTVFIVSIGNIVEQIDPYVVFDGLAIGRRKANIVFHTTSRVTANNGKENYITANVFFKKRNRKWIVTDLKISPRNCCDPLYIK